jgi:hypothetical protein
MARAFDIATLHAFDFDVSPPLGLAEERLGIAGSTHFVDHAHGSVLHLERPSTLIRQHHHPDEMASVLDLSDHGCSFEAQGSRS